MSDSRPVLRDAQNMLTGRSASPGGCSKRVVSEGFVQGAAELQEPGFPPLLQRWQPVLSTRARAAKTGCVLVRRSPLAARAPCLA